MGKKERVILEKLVNSMQEIFGQESKGTSNIYTRDK